MARKQPATLPAVATPAPDFTITQAELDAAVKNSGKPPANQHLTATEATRAAHVLIAGKIERLKNVPVETIHTILSTHPEILATGVGFPNRGAIVAWHQLSPPHDEQPIQTGFAVNVINAIQQHLLDQTNPFPATLAQLAQAFINYHAGNRNAFA